MIKIDTQIYVDVPYSEMIKQETQRKEFGEVQNNTFLLIVNNEIVSVEDYNNKIIKSDDVIKLLPILYGG